MKIDLQNLITLNVTPHIVKYCTQFTIKEELKLGNNYSK